MCVCLFLFVLKTVMCYSGGAAAASVYLSSKCCFHHGRRKTAVWLPADSQHYHEPGNHQAESSSPPQMCDGRDGDAESAHQLSQPLCSDWPTWIKGNTFIIRTLTKCVTLNQRCENRIWLFSKINCSSLVFCGASHQGVSVMVGPSWQTSEAACLLRHQL